MKDEDMNDRDRNSDLLDTEHAVNEWLETALLQYAEVQPRPGLDGRILANLQAERTRTPAPRRWWWVVGMATAMVAIAVTVWGWQSHHEVRSANTAKIANRAHREVANSQPLEPYLAKPAETHRSGRKSAINVAMPTAPKLEQFPSPQPLTEQEKLLMSYVAGNPEKAALVAQARAEALERDREEQAVWAARGGTE